MTDPCADCGKIDPCFTATMNGKTYCGACFNKREYEFFLTRGDRRV